MKITLPQDITARVMQAGVLATTFLPARAMATTNCTPSGTDINGAASCARATDSQPESLFGSGGIFQTVSEILIFLVGAISVIMLIWGGLQYVISAGDSKRVESAKSTIMYSIIGIVIAILAYAIVGFVTSSLTVEGTTAS